MSNGNGHRWSKFWWRDWQNDQDLRLCSLAAQGLWMRLLCIMHEADGRLIVHGTSPTDVVISALVGVKPREIRRYLDELLRFKVAKINDDGVIYCQRMINDIKASEAGREAVSLRKDRSPPTRAPNQNPSSATANPPASPREEKKRKEETRATYARERKEDFHIDLEEGSKPAAAPLAAEIERQGNPDDGTPSLDEIMRRRQAAHATATPLATGLGRSLRHVEYAQGARSLRTGQEQINAITPSPRPRVFHLLAEQLRTARIAAGMVAA